MKIMSKSYREVITLVLCLFMAGVSFQSCKDDKDEGFRLDAFGPSKVERGGDIYFIGSGLDKVTTIILPAKKADGSAWRFSKGEFVCETGKITLRIPEDYPFGISGQVILEFSDGTPSFTTVSSFMVLSEASISGVTAGNKENPILPNGSVKITGKALKAVIGIIFANGVELDQFETPSDKEIIFKLPSNASSGPFKLKVCGWEGADTTYVDGPDIFVLEPNITNIKSTVQESLVNVPIGSEIIVTGKDFWRIDAVDGKTKVLFSGGVDAEATVNGNELTLKLPMNLMVGENEKLTVTIFSNGTPVTSKLTFSIVMPEITDFRRSGMNFSITGKNLNATSPLNGSIVLVLEDDNKHPLLVTSSITPTLVKGVEAGFTGNILGVYLLLQSGQSTPTYWLEK